jgi:hypothetical protein
VLVQSFVILSASFRIVFTSYDVGVVYACLFRKFWINPHGLLTRLEVKFRQFLACRTNLSKIQIGRQVNNKKIGRNEKGIKKEPRSKITKKSKLKTEPHADTHKCSEIFAYARFSCASFNVLVRGSVKSASPTFWTSTTTPPPFLQFRFFTSTSYKFKPS